AEELYVPLQPVRINQALQLTPVGCRSIPDEPQFRICDGAAELLERLDNIHDPFGRSQTPDVEEGWIFGLVGLLVGDRFDSDWQDGDRSLEAEPAEVVTGRRRDGEYRSVPIGAQVDRLQGKANRTNRKAALIPPHLPSELKDQH